MRDLEAQLKAIAKLSEKLDNNSATTNEIYTAIFGVNGLTEGV